MKKTIPQSLLKVILLFALFSACTETQQVQRFSKTITTYEKVERDTTSTPYSTSYSLPVFKLIGNTNQDQTIGGVTIMCEVNTFKATRKTSEEKVISTADIDQPDYDVYKVSEKPYYQVSPDNVKFTIKVINNLDYPIEFNKVPIIFKMDGVGVSLSPETVTKWNNTIAAGGETTTFEILGPSLDELKNAKTVIINIQNIPTTYDKVSGNLQNFESFKWVFEISNETISKNDRIIYSYDETPVYKETCTACNGTGKVTVQETCTKCQGTKQLKYTDYSTGKSWIGNCDKCNGTGVLSVVTTCKTCKGKGKISYPKSKLPAVESTVTWSGWQVQVVTTPPGASIQVADISTSDYKNAGISNTTVYWLSNQVKSYPIILTYNGKSIKVLPYTSAGRETPKINVDFSKSEPVIKIGTKVE